MSLKDEPKIDPESISKILLIRLRRIGDLVLTTPAARALKTALPKARLVYLVEEPYRKLIEGNPDLDEVIVIGKKPSSREFLALAGDIRRRRFDAVLDFHGGPRASLLTWLSGAKLKVGYGVKYRRFIYDVRVPRRSAQGRIHSAENHVNLVRALGLEVKEIPSIILPDAAHEDKKRVQNLLAATWGSPESFKDVKIVVLHIGAGNKFRSWGAENLARLAVLLDGLPGVRTLLVGGPEDRPEETEILSKAPKTFSLVGRLNLIEMRDLMARATIFAGPDSGPMHMAAGAGLPIVAWFGPNLPAYFSPWKAARLRIVEKPFDCRPCKQRDCLHRDYRCIRTISPQEVFEACRDLLSPSQSASR